jgi:hypothetical protein
MLSFVHQLPSLSTLLSCCLVSLILLYAYRLLNLVLLQPYRIYLILRRQGIPGPAFIPFIGEAVRFSRYAKGDSRLNCFTLGRDYHQQYGPVLHLMFGPFNVLHLADPDLVLAAWKTQHHFFHKGLIVKTAVRELLGSKALSYMDEPMHSQLIRMVAPASTTSSCSPSSPPWCSSQTRPSDGCWRRCSGMMEV